MREEKSSREHLADRTYKFITASFSGIAFLFILAVASVLAYFSFPSIVVNGLSFFTTTEWNPKLNSNIILIHGIQAMQGSTYGILVFVVGTLISSGLAILLGVPAGLGIAIFLTQIAP